MMSVEEAFEAFRAAWNEARQNPSMKKEAGRLLGEAIKASGRTPSELVSLGCIADRTSVVRWIEGKCMPQPSQFQLLERFLVSKGARHEELAVSLLCQRYWPVMQLVLESDARGLALSQVQVVDLLDLALKSKKTLTLEMMDAFLGLE